MGRSSLSRNERYGTTIETQFDLYDQLDPLDWRTEVATGIAITAFEHAYETGDDSDAVAALEEFAAPHIEALYEDASVEVATAPWRDQLSGIETEYRGITLSPKSDRISEFGTQIDEAYDEDAFDYVVAPFAGGIPPLYTAAAELDAEPVLLRYSKDRGDDTVSLSPRMAERFDPHGSQVLVVDDVLEYGTTAQTVGSYLDEEGVSDQEMMVAWVYGDETDLETNEPFDPVEL